MGRGLRLTPPSSYALQHGFGLVRLWSRAVAFSASSWAAQGERVGSAWPGGGAAQLRHRPHATSLAQPGVAGGYAAEAGPGTRARSMPSAATTQAMAMLRSGSGRQEPKPLHRVPRTGWVYRNVEKPESVSDHMYRMAVMAMVTRDDRLNKDRCIRLALVHDMAECIVGDIAPADNIPKEEKHRREERRRGGIAYCKRLDS
ncbi:5'-deoxynucleotidase HDDC2 isoform X3 [Mus musculus]|uniref:5'-deoxynucleotidase HDDC2 isoform X3 n=1 Tax=Mus musculus TaxID=10090 RepID=UPI00167B5796|nr:5'-deoxynucleotidase HDDC2 isoform X3 [Mus musculus]